jgi:hypothetical protein
MYESLLTVYEKKGHGIQVGLPRRGDRDFDADARAGRPYQLLLNGNDFEKHSRDAKRLDCGVAKPL